jgi:type VI protein secretion system component Hcp
MPGFLMFEEFGITDTGMMADLAKTALRRVPMSWLLHGVRGEFNVDIDPLAMLRGDDLDMLNFGEPYKAWIAVRSIDHDIEGAASRDQDAEHERSAEFEGQLNSTGGPPGNGTRPPKVSTGMKDRRKASNLGDLTATVEIDASLPSLIKATLETSEDGKKAGKTYEVADIHMCTTAQIDVSQLTMGSNSPAASLIQTLVGALVFNIIPYLTISMRKVKIEKIDLDLEANPEQPPAAVLSLSFEKAIWTYHVINGSNMSLLSSSAEFDFAKRKYEEPSFSIGSMLNPFG